MSRNRLDFRDVSLLIQKFRDFLLGRKTNWDARFPPLMSSRTIPTPDIPRGPDTNYSNKYYYQRDALQSVKPPAVAPVAEGPHPNQDPTQKVIAGGLKPDTICFTSLPTPGQAWWWDGHCYYEQTCEPPSMVFTPTPPAAPSK